VSGRDVTHRRLVRHLLSDDGGRALPFMLNPFCSEARCARPPARWSFGGGGVSCVRTGTSWLRWPRGPAVCAFSSANRPGCACSNTAIPHAWSQLDTLADEQSLLFIAVASSAADASIVKALVGSGDGVLVNAVHACPCVLSWSTRRTRPH
jgi:hypothetical protein